MTPQSFDALVDSNDSSAVRIRTQYLPSANQPAAKIGVNVQGDPIDSRHRGGMRCCCVMRIAAAFVTSIRSNRDESSDDH